jgi:hypothetical protein
MNGNDNLGLHSFELVCPVRLAVETNSLRNLNQSEWQTRETIFKGLEGGQFVTPRCSNSSAQVLAALRNRDAGGLVFLEQTRACSAAARWRDLGPHDHGDQGPETAGRTISGIASPPC